jgi:predicted  nucleic acid-binding Zn-ribbon protein
METEITPEQKAYLATFAGRRDAALLEISNLQIAKEKLEKSNKEIAISYSDTEARMNKVLGRIEELTKKEAELPLLIARDIVSLESRKTCLATEVTSLTKMIDVLTVQKASLEKDVSSALTTFNTVKDETLLLDRVVDHVTKVSVDNARDINMIVADLKKSLEEIVAVNKKNVFETNVVIEKLPRMLVEAQKHGLIKNKI